MIKSRRAAAAIINCCADDGDCKLTGVYVEDDSCDCDVVDNSWFVEIVTGGDADGAGVCGDEDARESCIVCDHCVSLSNQYRSEIYTYKKFKLAFFYFQLHTTKDKKKLKEVGNEEQYKNMPSGRITSKYAEGSLNLSENSSCMKRKKLTHNIHIPSSNF